MEILLANPRGFCAGVTRAIMIVERALEKFGAPVYVRHEVVHNQFVCDGLRAKGAIFIEDVAEAPPGSVLVFSAHGVSKAVRHEAGARGFRVFDATCPLVTKVHVEVERMHAEGREIVVIGHKGHPEVEGTMGQCETGIYLVEKVGDVETLRVTRPEKVSFVTQTTLSMTDVQEIVDHLRRSFPDIRGPRKDDICYATQNRQNAIRALAAVCDLILVVGSPNSSNSRRLCEVAGSLGVAAYRVDSAGEIQDEWLWGKIRVGVSAGASAPEELVGEVIERLDRTGACVVKELPGGEENVHFPLPRGLEK
ncbi:MAG: 4-hydroxy-3-methylbut-2-enyl diphosphate reductase [Zoogloeaceae bacterium]|jgi:4-hydroxy-3-methylbut-2-enyl diphosphate reductase|nr:4-hydroxy-3-methylbut-2-enyl diphosphate reductase [Zoogloeaceae bacterium]